MTFDPTKVKNYILLANGRILLKFAWEMYLMMRIIYNLMKMLPVGPMYDMLTSNGSMPADSISMISKIG